jgi:hypothetical protein
MTAREALRCATKRVIVGLACWGLLPAAGAHWLLPQLHLVYA